MWALQDFDGKDLCIEKIPHIFHNLENHILNLRGELFILDRDLADAIDDAFY
jgi:hypothetical protein